MSAMFLGSEIASASDRVPSGRQAAKRQELPQLKAVGARVGIAVMLTASVFGTSYSIDAGAAPILSQQLPKASESQVLPASSGSSIIEPGKSVGPVALGDTRESMARDFPLKKDIDSEYKYPGSRSEIHWLDIKRNRVQGDVTFFLEGDRVFQIASASPSFRTQSGVTLYTSPAVVKAKYHGLEAFVLLNSGGDEVGGRDLVYWICRSEGIAFEFHFYPKRQRRLVYSVIIFKPGTDFFPKGSFLPDERWRRLPRYSLEPVIP